MTRKSTQKMILMKVSLPMLALAALVPLAALNAADIPKSSNALQVFKAKLQTTVTGHLNQLLNADGSVVSLKGLLSDV